MRLMTPIVSAKASSPRIRVALNLCAGGLSAWKKIDCKASMRSSAILIDSIREVPLKRLQELRFVTSKFQMPVRLMISLAKSANSVVQARVGGGSDCLRWLRATPVSSSGTR
jgi:hypothetical protein